MARLRGAMSAIRTCAIMAVLGLVLMEGRNELPRARRAGKAGQGTLPVACDPPFGREHAPQPPAPPRPLPISLPRSHVPYPSPIDAYAAAPRNIPKRVYKTWSEVSRSVHDSAPPYQVQVQYLHMPASNSPAQ
ncbi:hypothetical protein DAEQUDRAFT_568341 [Daedalea quercina L-15889]|uniref:Uncharacterized protein n=1 Tax=Daedalea quercina L-15889 TaxID=1314783 RepID=A0A165LVL5_9APHY|nr:hypothetical protein DAEQUDRAFT_568341 [Daedalea quercina L-15889]